MTNHATAASTPLPAAGTPLVPGLAGPRRRTFSVAALRQAAAGRRRRERRPFEGLPVAPGMPTEFGPHHRWPDGSFHYCC